MTKNRVSEYGIVYRHNAYRKGDIRMVANINSSKAKLLASKQPLKKQKIKNNRFTEKVKINNKLKFKKNKIMKSV